MTLRGLTWDHPRAFLPLEAFGAELPQAGSVTWARQSLADFEARPLHELAVDHDLLVIDHPSLGSAIAHGTLRCLDDLFDGAELTQWAGDAVGRTWHSYSLGGRQWALPIDAATQVGISAPELAGHLPTTWRDVPAFARMHSTALCLGGPHALLCLLAMCAGSGRGPGQLLEPTTAAGAIALLREVWVRAEQDVSVTDPIDIHEAIADARVAYCPLAYGYASYAVPAAGRRPVAWGAAPTYATTTPGSVLGGTGLAVSALSTASVAEVRHWVRAFLAADVQAGFVPAHGGQPAHRAAWDSASVDATWGGYYSATRSSIETAWVRPRTAGWTAFQAHASELVRQSVQGITSVDEAVAELNHEYALLDGRPAQAGAAT